MRLWRVTLAVLWSFFVSSAQVGHWTETAHESIWRGRYTNCDKGYAVDLPPNVVAHGSHPPNPNHGFLVSPDLPGTSDEITYENQRVIDVWDEYDSADFGGASAYLNWDLKQTPRKQVLLVQDLRLRGLQAVRVRYRTYRKGSPQLTEELIIYTRTEGLIYVIQLNSTPYFFEHDFKLYTQILKGFQAFPAPKGQCNNY